MGALIALAIASVLALAAVRRSDDTEARAHSESAFAAKRAEMDSTQRAFQLAIWRARYSFLFDDSVRTRSEIDSLVSRLGRLEAHRDSVESGSLDSGRAVPASRAVPPTKPRP